MSRVVTCLVVISNVVALFTVTGGHRCGVYVNLRTDPHPEFSETANSLQAQWLAKDKILVVASSTSPLAGSSGSPTKVWLGSSQQSGLYTFTKSKKNPISEAVNTQSLQVSRNGWNTAIVVAESQDAIYVTTDGSQSWHRYVLPERLFTDLVMSSVNPARLFLLSKSGNLYFSGNNAKSWNLISSNVIHAVFVNTSSTNEYLFYSVSSSLTNVNTLHRYNVHSKAKDVIDQSTYRFYIDNRYLYVSKQNYTGSSTDSRTRRIYVSTNFDQSHVTFTEVQLPATNWEDYVAVMATHETGAFIHISQAKDKEKGKLYVSDKSGAVFTLSLDNHLFQRISFAYFNILTFDDFYEVKSMRGVYITTAISSNNHYSVITYNNGASWQRITPPTGSNCIGSCSLHLHISYSQAANANFRTGPLSVSNAMGIIIAHGSLGVSRSYDPGHARIFVSADGGYSWKMHTNLTGTFTYGIADYGNIIAVVADNQTSRTLWFSHDRGDCFEAEDLDTTGAFKLSKGLLMDPEGYGLYAFALGLEGTAANDTWRLIAIAFSSILSSPCHPNDYMIITEHNISNTCILGFKQQFKVTKPSALCYNDIKYSPESVKIIPCNCTLSDMECDYGYTRNQKTSDGAFQCSPISGYNLSSVCPPGQEYYNQAVHGYRLIAGDLCRSDGQSQELLRTQRMRCTGHETNSGTVTNNKNSASVATKVIGVLIFIVTGLLAAAAALYCVMYCRSKRNSSTIHDRVVYKRIPLTDPGASPDESSSDEDILN